MPEITRHVPRLRYGVGEDFTAIGALKAGAGAMGREASYPWLMGIGGAAFRLYWSQEWSLDMANFVTADAVGTAAESVGLAAAAHMGGKPEDVWRMVRESIDADSPALSCGLTSPFETCLIVGYEDPPPKLKIRGYLDEEDDYSRLDFRPWYGWCHQSFGLMPVTTLKAGKEPDLPALVKASLATALRLAGEGRIVSGYCAIHSTKHVMVSGLDAYIAWAGGISEKPADDAAHRGFATSLNMNQLIDARSAAQNYLLDLCNRVRPAALLLSRAAEHYAHEVIALKSARQLIPYPQATPEKAAERLGRLLSDDQRRAEYASLLRTAQNEDSEALGWIRKVVDGGIL